MGANYVDGLLLKVVDGNELYFDDPASAFFDFSAYSLSMTVLNVVGGAFEPTLNFAPTPALVGTHLQPGADGWIPAPALTHPTAALAAQRHDIATNTAAYIVQTVYGWSRTVYAGLSAGALVYATLAGYAATGDHRELIGIAADDGIVLLDVFQGLDDVRGMPASALTNPTGLPQAARSELGNAFVALLFSSAAGGFGFGAPVFDPGTTTYHLPITVPLTKKPIAAISMCDASGTGKYAALVEVTDTFIRYAFYDAASDTRVQNTTPYAVKALGTTYQEL